MRQLFLRKTNAAIFLLLVLSFSIIASNTLLVNADRPGIGKYLTIVIDGEGYVTATKIESGEVWNYTKTNPLTEHKLGAGTVSLRAYAAVGWEFSHWEGDLTGIENPADYKSEKYGNITAVFEKKVFTITAIVASEASNGYIETKIDGNYIQIYDQLDVPVEFGASPTFDFYPDPENHVSAIQVDGTFKSYALTYTFPPVQEDHTLIVYFSADGEAYVPVGSNVEVYFTEFASLYFGQTTAGGSASGLELIRPEEWMNFFLWDITTLVIDQADGKVTITLEIEGLPQIINVSVCETVDAFYCDVNNDGSVTAADLSLVANYNKAMAGFPNEFPYDPTYDTNRDGEITQDDVHFVKAHKGIEITWRVLVYGTEWILDLDSSPGNTIIEIYIDEFSIFRGR